MVMQFTKMATNERNIKLALIFYSECSTCS